MTSFSMQIERSTVRLNIFWVRDETGVCGHLCASSDSGVVSNVSQGFKSCRRDLQADPGSIALYTLCQHAFEISVGIMSRLMTWPMEYFMGYLRGVAVFAGDVRIFVPSYKMHGTVLISIVQ